MWVLFNTPDLKVRNDNRHMNRPSFSGMLSSFQPIGMDIEEKGILGILRLQSMHIEYHRTKK